VTERNVEIEAECVYVSNHPLNGGYPGFKHKTVRLGQSLPKLSPHHGSSMGWCRCRECT
jgi:hypothetical protein